MLFNDDSDHITWREFVLVLLSLLICLTSECKRVENPPYSSTYDR